MKFLITGAKGQLAREFRTGLTEAGHETAAFDKEALDISDLGSIQEIVSKCQPDILLNCAAYNFVDKAEQDFDTAYRVNAAGVKNLASVCRRDNILMVHYSTDYIFDGTKTAFYIEEDVPNPLNKYGQSKLEGERLLMEELDTFLLFRVSWVFGAGKQNFLYKLVEWAKKNRVLRIVSDQLSIPTYTKDIVNLTMFAINKRLKGIYHLTDSGYASRYEVSRYFLEKIGMDNLILPVDSQYFPVSARRPYFSALSNQKLADELNVDIPDWKLGIDRYIQETFEKEAI